MCFAVALQPHAESAVGEFGIEFLNGTAVEFCFQHVGRMFPSFAAKKEIQFILEKAAEPSRVFKCIFQTGCEVARPLGLRSDWRTVSPGLKWIIADIKIHRSI